MNESLKNEFMKIDNFPELLEFIKKNNILNCDMDIEAVRHVNTLWIKGNPFPNNPDIHYDVRKKKK